ncbi:MAG TPA: hypothetical protein VHV08_03750 [Pirellulales bacterium]|nr:hypothetical protein [Pirellulales bacterium]
MKGKRAAAWRMGVRREGFLAAAGAPQGMRAQDFLPTNNLGHRELQG